jgi:hypothetical protein
LFVCSVICESNGQHSPLDASHMQPCWILTGTTIRVTTPISSRASGYTPTPNPHAHQTPTATPHSKLRTAPQAQPGAQASSWDGPDPKKQQSTEGTAPLAACPRGPCHAMPMSSLVKATRPSFLDDQGSYQPDPRPKTRPRIQTEERARRSVYSTGARGRTVQKRQGTRDEDAVAHPWGMRIRRPKANV